MTLNLHPQFDASFPCPQCAFVARGPGALEEHLSTHDAIPDVPLVRAGEMDAIPTVDSVGPVTEEIIPVSSVRVSRVFTCSTCGTKVTGYGEFMRHKKDHKRGILSDVKRIFGMEES